MAENILAEYNLGRFETNENSKIAFDRARMYFEHRASKMKETYKVTRKLELFFYDSTEFNAFVCAKHPGQIAVSAGLIGCLWNASYTMFCDDYFFPTLCDEPEIFSEIQVSKPENLSLVDFFRLGGSTKIIKDEMRLDIANLFFSQAFIFLIDHEFTHLFGGHVTYFAEQFGATRLQEGEMEAEGEELKIRLLCEVEADRFAMNNNIQDYCIGAAQGKFGSADIVDKLLCKDKNFKDHYFPGFSLVYLFFSASYFFFALLEDEYHNKDPLGLTHPQSAVRQFNLLRTVSQSVGAILQGNYDIDNLASLSAICAKRVDITIGRICGTMKEDGTLVAPPFWSYVSDGARDDQFSTQELKTLLKDYREPIIGQKLDVLA